MLGAVRRLRTAVRMAQSVASPEPSAANPGRMNARRRAHAVRRIKRQETTEKMPLVLRAKTAQAVALHAKVAATAAKRIKNRTAKR